MYKVIAYFKDLQDNNYEYNVGDVFPREGLEVSDERIAELSGKENKRRIPLIEFDEEAAKAAEEAAKAAEEAKKAEEEAAKKKAEEEAARAAEGKKPAKK